VPGLARAILKTHWKTNIEFLKKNVEFLLAYVTPSLHMGFLKKGSHFGLAV